MPKVKLLDRDVYELIAAGEVVERPVSVVKELVENSIDAGASSIEVELIGGGLKSIRVKDNGCGISREDIPVAFLRHATSKIANATDLESIGTLGFRGEALASIAAVSRVRMYSAVEGKTGTEYIIEGGREISLEDSGVPSGTTVIVEYLFYNTPARMKFLKKDVYESNAVQTLLEQLLLSHPEISFKFIRDGKTAFTSPGDGSLYSALCYIWPSDVIENLVEVNDSADGIEIYGYISNPTAARKSRSMQSLFVNGRYIVSRSIASAVEEGTKGFYITGNHPAFTLFVTIPAAEIDVNVHPAKTEIRFSNERKVTSLAYVAVKMVLEVYTSNPVNYLGKPEIEPEVIDRKLIYVNPEKTVNPQIKKEHSENTIREESPEPLEKSADSVVSAQDKHARVIYESRENDVISFSELHESKPSTGHFTLDVSVDYNDYESWLNRHTKSVKAVKENVEEAVQIVENLPGNDGSDTKITNDVNLSGGFRYVGELFKTYIVLEYGDRMVLIDKHAAHERLMYDKYVADGVGGDRQVLLSSVIVSLSAEEVQAVEDNYVLLCRVGFLIEPMGSHEVAVREIPVYSKPDKIKGVVEELASTLVSMHNDITTEEEIWLLHSSACRCAIKGGNISSNRELIDLAERILAGKTVMQCPHGRPVCTFITQKELERRFGRIQ